MARDFGDASELSEVTSDYLVRIVDNPNSEYPVDKLIPGTDMGSASAISVLDTGGYYTGSSVETVLAEIGSRSVYIDVRRFGVVGDGTTDDTMAFQAAIDGAARGRGYNLYIPANFRIRITSQIVVPSNAHIYGAGAQPATSFEGGSEILCDCADGVTAVVTASTIELDWSRGLLKDFRITNAATGNASGIGLHVRNPQNASLLDQIMVTGFPTRACLVSETRTVSDSTAPGVFFIDRCFFVGGVYCLEISGGTQPVSIDRTGIDTNATTTGGGVLVSPGRLASVDRRWPVSFRSTKVEIAATTVADVPGWVVTSQAPIVWDSCNVQDATGSTTRAAIEHTNATIKWAHFDIRNMTVLGMAYGLLLNSAGASVPNPAASAPWNFSWDWSLQSNAAYVYSRDDIAAALAGGGVRVAPNAESSGPPMPMAGIITGWSLGVNAAITAGSVTPGIYKNGSTYVTQLALSSSNQRRWANLLFDGGDLASTDLVFAAGDRIGCLASASADLAPAGSLDLTVVIYVRFFPRGA